MESPHNVTRTYTFDKSFTGWWVFLDFEPKSILAMMMTDGGGKSEFQIYTNPQSNSKIRWSTLISTDGEGQ